MVALFKGPKWKEAWFLSDIEEKTRSYRDDKEIQTKEEARTENQKETDIDTILLVPVFRNSLGQAVFTFETLSLNRPVRDTGQFLAFLADDELIRIEMQLQVLR